MLFECSEKKNQETKKKYNLPIKIFKFRPKKSTNEVFGKKKYKKSTNQQNGKKKVRSFKKVHCGSTANSFTTLLWVVVFV